MADAKSPSDVLLVEGLDDYHVIRNLCGAYSLKQNFNIEYNTNENEGGGWNWVLRDVPVRLKQSGLKTLGIVIDADDNLSGRWGAILDRLGRAGYKDLPELPHQKGSIIFSDRKPKVGIWIMPDNQLKGMLEDFMVQLIPTDDALRNQIETHLYEIESRRLHKYNHTLHHSKALIHSWLACQESPGRPLGQAITCRYLSSEQPIATIFSNWLKILFNA